MKEPTIQNAYAQMEIDAKKFTDSLDGVSDFTKKIAESAYLAGEVFIASKILDAKSKEPSTKEIDWEQRRYEIAKAALVGVIAKPLIPGADPYATPKEEANYAIKMTDALIAELKKTSK